MSKHLLMSRGPSVAIVALAAFLGGAWMSVAAIPDRGTLSACMSAAGQLRVIDTAKTRKCRKGERLISWSQTGVPGPAGPQGPRGVPGFTTGITEIRTYRREAQKTTQPGGNLVSADCDPGDVVVGGGHINPDLTGGFTLEGSKPLYSSEGWAVHVNNTTSGPVRVYAYAICLDK